MVVVYLECDLNQELDIGNLDTAGDIMDILQQLDRMVLVWLLCIWNVTRAPIFPRTSREGILIKFQLQQIVQQQSSWSTSPWKITRKSKM